LTTPPARSLAATVRFWAGTIVLAAGLCAAGVLVYRRFSRLEAQILRPESADYVPALECGDFAGWPISFVGAAFFAGLLAARWAFHRASRSNPSRGHAPLVLLSAVFTLVLAALAVANHERKQALLEAFETRELAKSLTAPPRDHQPLSPAADAAVVNDASDRIHKIETQAASQFSSALQIEATLATVRVVNPSRSTSGSGVIVGHSGPVAYVLTANHLVEQGKPLKIDVFSAKSYPRPAQASLDAQVVATLPEADLAVIRLVSGDESRAALRICPLASVPTGQSFAGLTVGCAGDSAPMCRSLTVSERRSLRKRDGDAPALVWEVDQPIAQGTSGGPLVDRRGFVLGIASGTDKNNGYYCAIDDVYRLLDRNGLGWLYQEEAKAAAVGQ
jgi:S1-C subfamily serine protease